MSRRVMASILALASISTAGCYSTTRISPEVVLPMAEDSGSDESEIAGPEHDSESPVAASGSQIRFDIDRRYRIDVVFRDPSAATAVFRDSPSVSVLRGEIIRLVDHDHRGSYQIDDIEHLDVRAYNRRRTRVVVGVGTFALISALGGIFGLLVGLTMA